MPLDELLDELLERVRKILAVDTVAVLLLEDDGRLLAARAAKGLEEEVEVGVRVPVGRGFAGRVAAERAPVQIPDVDHADIFNPILRQKGLKSLLGVPLLVEDRLLGVIHVGALQHRAFSPDDVDLLQRVADRIALAIGARLYERQRGLAEEIQHSLFPNPLPDFPGVAIAARYFPAAAAPLGGDWYDAFVLPSGSLGLAIGDVVGRGFKAAALMGQLRSALRAYAFDGNAPWQLHDEAQHAAAADRRLGKRDPALPRVQLGHGRCQALGRRSSATAPHGGGTACGVPGAAHSRAARGGGQPGV